MAYENGYEPSELQKKFFEIQNERKAKIGGNLTASAGGQGGETDNGVVLDAMLMAMQGIQGMGPKFSLPFAPAPNFSQPALPLMNTPYMRIGTPMGAKVGGVLSQYLRR